MVATTSSYEKNDFRKDFFEIISKIQPELIVEFGIGNGYSLQSWIDFTGNNCEIHCYDLFDDFPYHHASYDKIKSIINESSRVCVEKLDFYKGVDRYADGQIDLLHIDIANNGDTFQFAFENYLNKISDKGVMIFEGGSTERDNVYWMSKFNKRKINPYLMEVKDKYNIQIIEKYPSLTIVKK